MFAKEGYPFIILTGIMLLIAIFTPKILLIIICAVTFIFMFCFFRDPERIPPVDEDAIVSGADGKIVEISKVTINGVQYQKVSVFMSLFNVHVNRAPYTGTIKNIKHFAGTFLPADKPEASAQNERNEIHISTPGGTIIAVQIAGLIARRIVTYNKINDTIHKGSCIGMIKFSSRVDHYLPDTIELNVTLEQKVKAGESVIARFI